MFGGAEKKYGIIETKQMKEKVLTAFFWHNRAALLVHTRSAAGLFHRDKSEASGATREKRIYDL